jgi:HAD superfamily hydrolase (TIGR01509 family)
MRPPRALDGRFDLPHGDAVRSIFMRMKRGDGLEEIRAVLFDLDGVLIDSYEAWFRLVNAAARHFRKPDVSPERFRAGWGQGLDADVRDFFAGCTPDEIESFYEDHLLDYTGHIQVEPGARDLLLELRNAEVLRAVVTNTPASAARDVLAWVGLIGLVDFTSGPGGGVRPKPAPDTIQAACSELQVRSEAAVFVGDSEFDAQAAVAARTRFIGFRCKSERSVQSLHELAKLVVPSAR